MIISYVLYIALLSSITTTRPVAADEINKDNCIYCQAIVAATRLAEKGKFEKEEIEEQITELCATLSPHSFSCLIQSRKLMPFIIDATANFNKEPEACSQLSKANCQSVVGAESSIDLRCKYCEAMAHLLEETFSRQTIQVGQLVESVCKSTKQNRNGKFCDKMLTKDNLDLSVLSSAWRNLYQQLLSCKKGNAKENTSTSARDFSKNVTCTLCHVSMEFLQLAMDEFHVEKNGLSLLESLCSHLPLGVQKDATFVNINAKLSGLFWARHQREVCSSSGRSSCLQAPPSDRLRQGPQLSALTLSRRALVHLVSQTGGTSAQPTEHGGDTTTNE
ncbi:hypothetical protein M513_10805 [Trichuris suis]|uniref:Saposin B-type domain-containing protein n=1 Tax=Trichuris suis TaxID=68888 RepID=A0A085LTL7_9BILA|nr:hypothetical protein M513_10805 [Trichuris suis]